MTREEFDPFPGDQIQFAAVVPGPSTRIALVNDKNKLFLLRPIDGRWMFESVNCTLDETRLDIKKIDERVSMAANETGTLRIFWMQGTEGRLLSIDITRSNSSKAEKILTPF